MSKPNHYEACQNFGFPDQTDFEVAISTITNQDHKQDEIRKLQQKNNRLLYEINKIDKTLQESQVKNTSRISILPQIKSKATEKELQNAYKLIKNYEYEIKRMKFINEDGGYANQVSRLEKLLKEKQNMSDKLRKQIAAANRSSIQITKTLKSENEKASKEDNHAKYLKLTKEMQHLKEKVEEIEENNNSRLNNKKKQWNYIVKLQNELLEEGISSEFLRILKDKVVNKKSGVGNSDDGYYYDEKDSRAGGVSRLQLNDEDQIEDRTPQAYLALKNEIKILEKLQKGYESKIQSLEREKEGVVIANNSSLDRMMEIENSIATLQATIRKNKEFIDPAKLRPSMNYSMISTGSGGASKNSRIVSLKESFILPKHTNIKKNSPVQEAMKFNDRQVLGVGEFKIVGIDFYENIEAPHNIMGIQTTYLTNKNEKKTIVNTLCHPQATNKKSVLVTHQDDYFKQIDVVANEQGLIVGIKVTSKQGVFGSAGHLQGNFKSLNVNMNQYPICFFGNISSKGLQVLAAETSEDKNK